MSVRFAVAAVVGVAAGYFGGPVAGAQAFAFTYGATGFLDPAIKTQGPRLDDLKLPSGAYGSPIPYVEGHPREAGNIAWCLNPRREVASESSTSGKGGPRVDNTSFTYEVDMLILISENPGKTVRRIFSNGALVWTRADDSDATSLGVSNTTTSWRDIRFYDGNDAQLPDPTYEAAVGIGNAPAYRGRSSMFIEGLNCGQSGQLPVLTFEVVSNEPSTVQDLMAQINTPGANSYGWGIPPMSNEGFIQLLGIWNLSDESDKTTGVYHVAASGEVTLLGKMLSPIQSDSGSGNSDETCMIFHQPAAGGETIVYVFYDPNVSFGQVLPSLTLELPPGFPGVGGSELRMSKVGNDMVFSSGFVANSLFRFNRTTRAMEAHNASCPTIASLAIGGAFVYALHNDGHSIDVYNLSDLAFVRSIPATPYLIIVDPGSANQSTLVPDEFGNIYLAEVSSGRVYRLDLPSTWTLIWSGDEELTEGNYANFSIREKTFFSIFGNTVGGVPRSRVIRAQIALALPSVPLADVVSRQWVRAGLDTSLLDVTQLAGLYVRSMALTQLASPRAVIELLGQMFFFEPCESDKVRMVLRGGAPVATIPYEDLGAFTNSSPDERLPRSRGNELEITSQVSIKFANVDDDYQDGNETSTRIATGSGAISATEIPLGMTPTEAKQLAEKLVTDAFASNITFGPFSLTKKWTKLEPTDPVLLEGKDGTLYRARITKRTDADGLLTFESVNDNPTALVSSALGSSGYTNTTSVRALVDTTFALLDIPPLRDEDTSAPGFYVAAKPLSPNGAWNGFQLLRSADGVTYEVALTSNSAATMGVTTSALGDFSAEYVFDETNSLMVNIGSGGLLSSVTRDAMLGDESVNAAAVGKEIVQFRDATLVSDGVWKLTGFLRARRGTSWARAMHSSPESFVLLNLGSLRRVSDQQTDVGLARYWKAVSIGRSTDTGQAILFTDTGESEKPFSPVDARAARSLSGAVTLNWKRRTRMKTRSVGALGGSVPLGETTEAYSIDVYSDSTFASVKRTLSSTATSVVYTGAQQLADFTSLPTSLSVEVFQLSSAIGRGHGRRATLSVVSGATQYTPDVGSTASAIFATGSKWLIARQGTGISSTDHNLGFYTYSGSGSTMPFLGVGPSVPSTPSRGPVFAADRASDRFVLFLNGSLFYGQLPSTLSSATPSFLGAGHAPFAVWWSGTDFRVLTTDGHTWSSPTGAVWTDAGAATGIDFTPLGSATDYIAGVVVIGAALSMKLSDVIYSCSNKNGTAWTTATGDIATPPLSTYADVFTLVGIASTGGRGLISVIAKKSADATPYALLYTSTDGTSWSKVYESAVVAPGYYAHSPLYTAGVLAFGSDFLVDVWPIQPGTGDSDILTVYDSGSWKAKFAFYETDFGDANSTGVLAHEKYSTPGVASQPYFTSNLFDVTHLTWIDP